MGRSDMGEVPQGYEFTFTDDQDVIWTVLLSKDAVRKALDGRLRTDLEIYSWIRHAGGDIIGKAIDRVRNSQTLDRTVFIGADDLD
jgi:hypothetical protein